MPRVGSILPFSPFLPDTDGREGKKKKLGEGGKREELCVFHLGLVRRKKSQEKRGAVYRL